MSVQGVWGQIPQEGAPVVSSNPEEMKVLLRLKYADDLLRRVNYWDIPTRHQVKMKLDRHRKVLEYALSGECSEVFSAQAET